MSDTTAFLSGCAITGIVAVLLLGGGFAVDGYRRSPPPQSMPTVPDLPPVPVPPSPNFDQPTVQERALERELEQQRDEAERLKNQIEKQQNDIQGLTTQIQEQQRLIHEMSAQVDVMSQRSRIAPAVEQPDRFQTVTLIAVGVTLLVVLLGGGIILVAVIVLLVQAQSQRRPSRSMPPIIHHIQTPYGFPNQEFLPPSIRTPRRTRQIDYEE
ncbi:hypothetical protein IQ268_25130 [Oculatella sp. LEGE 06141]|uniref:hypothetical protein n=1 Tax=Oculatella sp. LEGE 06141 TaxID=1828648 RepID=UPI00187FBBEA|nr:hypothetical protein [Oculatella sp. LEGE 06141]MBE9181856.1 hypothetical protein [Oculatella sp. LEGE 06141]